MAVHGVHRRSQAEVARLVGEFELSGLGRKEFAAAHGLSVHTLDAWRRRVARSGVAEKIVPVEIVEDRAAGRRQDFEAASRLGGQIRVVLPQGIRIEIEPDFDAAQLRRLIAALTGTPLTEQTARVG